MYELALDESSFHFTLINTIDSIGNERAVFDFQKIEHCLLLVTGSDAIYFIKSLVICGYANID